MSDAHNFGGNVGSNWGVPYGYGEMLQEGPRINADAMGHISKNFSNSISSMMEKYEESKKTGQTAKALQNAIKAIGENEGMDQKLINASMAQYADETAFEHLQRMKAMSSYVMDYASNNQRTRGQQSQQAGTRRDFSQYGASIFGDTPAPQVPPQTPSINGGFDPNAVPLPESDLIGTPAPENLLF